MKAVSNQFQHYVSQFYLRGWQVKVNSIPKRVWIYEKGKSPRHSAIKRVAGEENFYAIRDFKGDMDNSTVEQFLGQIESKAGTIFQKILEQETLIADERKYFAEFLMIFCFRSPASKKRISQLVVKELPKVVNPLRALASSRDDEIRRKGLENIEKVERWHLENPDALFPFLVKRNSEILDVIQSMDWGFFCSKNEEFLTCDNPFVYCRGTGIGNKKNAHIIFPINCKMSFQAMHSTELKDNYVEIDNGLIQDINKRVVGNAFRQVYSSYLSDELNEYIQKHIGEDIS